MLIKNCTYLSDAFVFEKGDIRIEDEKIVEIAEKIEEKAGEKIIDAGFKKVIPGLIDIHTHGSRGFDTCDNIYDGFKTITKYMADNGITSYMPTTMTLSKEALVDIMKTVKKFKDEQEEGCYIQGINMEGPYFNMAKKGAQNGDYIMDPDFDHFMEIYEACGGIIKIVGVAPELPGAEEFIKKASKLCTVSIGHTNAKYEDAVKAIESGATHTIHLFNAMPGYTHREPGVIGAIMDSECTAELICDGIHIHPAVIRNTFKTLGDDRVVLISDSMKACGMEDGMYDLGGQDVIVKGNLATLKDGTIAGSATNVMQCMRNVVKFGILLENAVKAATINPAKVIGVDDICGSIKEGKNADIVILEENLDISKIIIKGKEYK